MSAASPRLDPWAEGSDLPEEEDMSTAVSRPQPLRTAWRAAHTPAPGVPTWAVITAHVIPLIVLPSSVWRVVVVFAGPPDPVEADAGDLPEWLPIEVYVCVLSVVSELVAFAAIGLIARWGEVFPRWLPGVGARRVPTLLATVPAALAALVLTAVSLTVAATSVTGRTIRGEPHPAGFPLHFRDVEGVMAVLAYAPLLLWGPLLAAVTLAYWQRRRDRTS
jgi:hypothetical protein